MKVPNTPYSFIAIGGSHVDSSYVGEDFSFTNLLTRQTGYQCLANLCNSALKPTARILQQQIDKYNPEIILLKPDYLTQKYKTENAKLSFLLLLNFFILFITQNLRNKKYFKEIKTIIDNNPQKQFIILSPVPCDNKYLENIKRIRGKEMSKILLNATNATYINLSKSIKKKKKFFIESSHLNRFGHTLLARLIAQKSSLSFSAIRRSYAA